MDRLAEIGARLRAGTDDGAALTDANCPRWYLDVAWLVARVRELSALHADALAGWNKSIDRVAELGAERNEARAIALLLVEALEATRAPLGQASATFEALRADPSPFNGATARIDAAISDPRLQALRGK